MQKIPVHRMYFIKKKEMGIKLLLSTIAVIGLGSTLWIGSGVSTHELVFNDKGAGNALLKNDYSNYIKKVFLYKFHKYLDKFPILAGHSIYLKNFSLIYTRNTQKEKIIWVNNGIKSKNFSLVYGGINACKFTDFSYWSYLKGVQYSDKSPINFKGINLEHFKLMAKAGRILNGDVKYTDTKDVLGPVYINGSLIVEDKSVVNLSGVIYVKGQVTVNNFSKITGDFTLLSEGPVIIRNMSKLQNNQNNISNVITVFEHENAINIVNLSKVFNCRLIASNGSVHIRNGSTVSGSVMAWDIYIENFSRVINTFRKENLANVKKS
ncbi:hypothetical protein ACFL4O_02570 [bacterium]